MPKEKPKQRTSVHLDNIFFFAKDLRAQIVMRFEKIRLGVVFYR